MANIEDNEGLENLERSLTLGLDDKYDEVKQLMDMGKEKGYLLYDEVNDLLPGDVTSSEEMDDMFSLFRAQGIEVIDGEPKAAGAEKLGIEKEAGDDVELDLTPGALDKTNDPVRLYLREMGTVPLLTREGEVEIAKRIERGQLNVLKAMSRSPIVIKEVINLGDQLERGERSINDVIVFNEDMMTEEKVEDRLKETVQKIEEIQKSFKKQNQLLQKYLNTPKTKHPKAHRKLRFALARHRVSISQAIRNIDFTFSERNRLIDQIRRQYEAYRPLEREQGRLEKKVEHSKGKNINLLRKDLRSIKEKIATIEEDTQTKGVDLKRTLQTIDRGDHSANYAKRELVEANRMLMPIDHVTGWLFRVARSRIIDRFRTRRREEPHLEDLLPSPDAGPDALYARRVLLEAIEVAIDELPREQREVFVLHEFEGRSFKEMSERSGESINTLLSRKRYAVLHLRRRLQPLYDELVKA